MTGPDEVEHGFFDRGPEYLQFRYTRLVRLRWIMSSGPLMAFLGMFTSYFLRGNTGSTGKPITGVVGQIDDLGPVWETGFGVALAVILFALIFRRFLAGSHIIGAAVMTGYVVALAYELLLIDGGGWSTASLAAAVAMWTFLLAVIYSKGR